MTILNFFLLKVFYCIFYRYTTFKYFNSISDLCAKQATVVDIKLHPDRGYGFVKYATKDEACRAIVNMHGYNINGTILKCNWGKEDVTGKNFAGGAGGSSASGMGFYGANAMDASQAAMASQMTPYGSTASGGNSHSLF